MNIYNYYVSLDIIVSGLGHIGFDDISISKEGMQQIGLIVERELEKKYEVLKEEMRRIE